MTGKTANITGKRRINSSVLGRRIIMLCLSLVIFISVIFTVVALVSISNITNRNLQNTAALTVKYIDLDVRNSILPAFDLTLCLATEVPLIGSNKDMEEIFPNC